jgi:hypothetical protein
MRRSLFLLLLGCQANVSLGGPDPADAATSATCGPQPSIVVSGLGTISAISVAGGYVYVASPSANQVARVPVSGGPIVVLASVPSPVAIAQAADQIVVGAGVMGSPGTGSLVSVPLAGGVTTTLAIGLDFPSSVATADGLAFASDSGGPNVKLIRAPLVGSSVDAGAVASPSPTPSGTGIAALGGFVFVGDGLGGLQRFTEQGGPPTAITGGVAKTLAVAASGQRVAWIAGGATDGVVVSVDASGANVVTLASAQKTPVSVATDGTDVFWSTQGTPGQNDATLARTSGTILTGVYQSFGSIALDASCIYWSDASGNVLRMTR